MKDRRGWSVWGRAVAVIAVVALGVMTVAPAFSAHKNKHVRKVARKVARKQATKQINKLVPGIVETTGEGLFVSNADYQTFSAFMDTDGQEVTLVQHGPLSLKASCVIDDGGSDELEVSFDSTAPDWWFSLDGTGDGPNAANSPVSAFSVSESTGTENYTNDIDDGSAAVSSGGTTYYLGVDGETIGLGLNVFGHVCFAAGAAFTTTA